MLGWGSAEPGFSVAPGTSVRKGPEKTPTPGPPPHPHSQPQGLGEMYWLFILPGAQQGHCAPRKDCVGLTKTQAYLVYSPPSKLPGGSTKTLDVKLHTGCPSNTEVNWKQSSDQERRCLPKDGHGPFSTTGQPGERRRSSKEGSLDRWGWGLGGAASTPTCLGGGGGAHLIPCPTPGRAPRPCL